MYSSARKYEKIVYQGFRLNLGKSREMIIFASLLTSFIMSNSFGEAQSLPEIGLSLSKTI